MLNFSVLRSILVSIGVLELTQYKWELGSEINSVSIAPKLTYKLVQNYLEGYTLAFTM